MPPLWAGLAATAGAYVLGSISPSFLAYRWTRGGDIRDVGSGNAGATNVLRSAGRGPAIAVLLADIAKGAVPVIVARQIDLGPRIVALVALAAVVGHVFPLFMRFRGGKGVATAAGALGALSPWAIGLSALVFVAVVGITRYVSLGSVVATLSFPVILGGVPRLARGWGAPGWAEAPESATLTAALGIGLLILFKHRTNLERLLRSEERRLGEGRRRGNR